MLYGANACALYIESLVFPSMLIHVIKPLDCCTVLVVSAVQGGREGHYSVAASATSAVGAASAAGGIAPVAPVSKCN